MTTFKSFTELADFCGIKSKNKKKEKVIKCPNCGGQMRRTDDSNVWVCDFSKMEEKTIGDKVVQVFSPCNNFFLAPVE